MNRLTFIFSTLLLVLTLAACSSSVDPNTPPEIVYGEDICARCGMIINDERFAASVVVEKSPKTYEHVLFDDIGNMLAYAQEEGEHAQIVTYFVHDYHSREWLNAREAHYLLSDELQTPMAFGIAAFKERSAAEAEAKNWHGTVVDFATVSQQIIDPSHKGHTHNH
jgi:copper chaperone NosL